MRDRLRQPKEANVFLTAHDESFNHQTSLPHMMVSNSDPNWRERYWFSIQDVERQDFILSGGLGKYPNKDVLEDCVRVQHGDRQWNLRDPRAMLPEPGKIDRESVGEGKSGSDRARLGGRGIMK